LIFSQKNKNSNEVVELNIKNQIAQMPAGMYFITVKNGDKQSAVKWLMLE
jgi:hypothetical protein